MGAEGDQGVTFHLRGEELLCIMFLADIRSRTPALNQGKCMYTVLYASE